MKKLIIIALSIVFLYNNSFSQDQKNKSYFKEVKPGFYQNSILKDVNAVKEKKEAPKTQRIFKVDMSGVNFPNKIDMYKSQWHNPPISQGNAGTCWCFSTTSFYESEIFRLTHQKVKLSEIYTVYWEYVEKARRFVRERGNSAFAEGSEANSVTRMYKMYGVVPEDAYTGLPQGQKFHSHAKMFDEMNNYLTNVKTTNSWNEDQVISTIKSILNFYLGVPPAEVMVGGKKYTPKEYLRDYLKLNMDDYVDILSYMQEPFYKKCEYTVEDNWWHNADYYNVPLEDYMNVLKNAIKNGYTIAIGGDVSEAGLETGYQSAIIPTFDIPVANIDDNSRQFRFSNKTTTDDHGMHLVGYVEKDGYTWFLVKDSSAGSRNNDENAKEFGYYFFREDYVKLKMMDFCIHKDAAKDILAKFK
jgi:bleomycin hydrolase